MSFYATYPVKGGSGGGSVTSVFGRTGAVVAVNGDYDLGELGDVDLTTPPTDGQVLTYDNASSTWIPETSAAPSGAGNLLSDSSASAITIPNGNVWTDTGLSVTVTVDSVDNVFDLTFKGFVTGTSTNTYRYSGYRIDSDTVVPMTGMFGNFGVGTTAGFSTKITGMTVGSHDINIYVYIVSTNGTVNAGSTTIPTPTIQVQKIK